MADDPIGKWHLSPVSNRDYDFIDGLRGVAILLVLECHLFYINPDSGRLMHVVEALSRAGSSGVTLFFALSGFLISWPFWKAKIKGDQQVIPPGYFQRRFFKIYPPLALSVLLLTPIYLYASGKGSLLQTAGEWLVGLPLIMPVSGKINPVMWSLIIEVQFYLTLPVLMIALKKIPAKICLWLLPLILLAAGAGRRIISASTYGPSETGFTILNYPFPSDLDVFAFGVLVAGLYSLKIIHKKHGFLGNLGLAMFIGMLFIVAWRDFGPQKSLAVWELIGLGVKVSCGLILFYIVDPGCWIARQLCHPLLRWLGVISYEWYLFHQPIILWARAYFGPCNGNVLKFSALLTGSFLTGLILAALVYRIFSLPILREGRELSRK